MDPVTAFVNLAQAILKFATVIAEGQPPDVREQIWRMYLSDLKAIRRALNIPTE